MAHAIIMPKTGMAMEEGVIVRWLMKEGETVKKGDPVVEIETDKSAMEVEADYDGVLLKILYGEGATVPVVRPIAFIGTEGENLSELAAQAEGEKAAVESDRETGVPPPAVARENRRVKATPAARRLARERGTALEGLVPSGRFGEIREGDVAAVTAPSPEGWIAADRGLSPGGRADASLDTRVKLTSLQKVTGHRMLQSHREIPPVTENIRADVSEMLSLRRRLNETLEDKITINDLVLLAVVKALKDNPRLNSVLEGDEVIYRGAIHLGLAVAAPKGLLVPVLRDAGNLTLTAMAARARDLAVRGREGKLKARELSGSTFTVSNLGMFGIDSFTPIINQPEAAVLGVCAVEDRLRMIEEVIVNRRMMGLSLTFDHRVLDGAEVAVFLKSLRDYLEAPLGFLV